MNYSMNKEEDGKFQVMAQRARVLEPRTRDDLVALDGAVGALADRLAEHPGIEFALLFGSRASGSPRPDSDWDVAVYLTDELDAYRRFKIRLRLLAELADLGPIDLVVLNDAPPFLAHQALLGQRLLIRNRQAWVRFFVRTIAMSEDERPYRDLHRRARLERLREGRFGRP